MDQNASLLCILFTFFCLLHHLSYGQQFSCSKESPLDCNVPYHIYAGFSCAENSQSSCPSLATFRAKAPYDSCASIANLLNSEASDIALISNCSGTHKLPPNELIIVPISCSCWGNRYGHFAPYTVKNKSETYSHIAMETYQRLTTCQDLITQNKYDCSNPFGVGSELVIPVECACPTKDLAVKKVTTVMTYMVTEGDTFSGLAERFGANVSSIMDLNLDKVSEDRIMSLDTVLIPLTINSCTGEPGSAFCYCPNGQIAYQKGGRSSCPANDQKGSRPRLDTILGVVIGVGILCLSLIGYGLIQRLKKRRDKFLREKHFKQNGGLLLQQRFLIHGSSEKAKIFTAEELQRATDNYNLSRFLGQGGYGTVYKGMLPDGSVVAVKKSKAIDKSRIEQFINEVVILSQINHRNVVKLLGCCLETEVPLLVYEFIPNGNLSRHIHNQDPELSLSWRDRFRIACEVAGAIAYMHSSASIPIFHRDIKSSNILLDEKYSAKVSDFGTSRSVPLDKTHFTTVVQGTFGYLDPEYFQSSQFTEKSDVYSFGVVLLELITGEKPISFAQDTEGRNLVAHFISSWKEGCLSQILDPRVAGEATEEDILEIAELARRCLRLNGKERPTMKEVGMVLEGIRTRQRCVPALEEMQSIRRATLSVNSACSDCGIIISLDMEASTA